MTGADADEIDLVPAQVRGLIEAERCAEEALADVGELHLEHEAARSLERALSHRLEQARTRARQALGERERLYEAIVDTSALPDGEWTLDRARGKLVRRKTGHA